MQVSNRKASHANDRPIILLHFLTFISSPNHGMGIALLFVYEVIQNKVKYFLSPKTFNMYYKVSFYAYGHKTKRFPCGIKMSCPVELVVSKL